MRNNRFNWVTDNPTAEANAGIVTLDAISSSIRLIVRCTRSSTPCPDLDDPSAAPPCLSAQEENACSLKHKDRAGRAFGLEANLHRSRACEPRASTSSGPSGAAWSANLSKRR